MSGGITLKIDRIDRNLAQTGPPSKYLCYYDVCNHPFVLYGVTKTQSTGFVRLPEEVAAQVSEGVQCLCHQTAGGRVRFCTDSTEIALHAFLPELEYFPHMSLLGSSGFDLYVHGEYGFEYCKSFIPSYENTTEILASIQFSHREMREIIIHFPLYQAVDKLLIGLDQNSEISTPSGYSIACPIVFYGSSITQGGCASRPGNAYQAIISRMLDCDFVNLGFSGNAKGEPSMAEYISGLDMTAFVYDYDCNAPDAQYLQKTHEPFFKIIRNKQPSLPVIMVSRPDFAADRKANGVRRDIIRKTYENAPPTDNNVYFIDGEHLFDGNQPDSCTVDGCHPNDLGFMRMAKKIGSVLQHII